MNSKSCTTFTTDVQNCSDTSSRNESRREKIRTVEELQQCITEEWEHLDQSVIDNAVKQWRKHLSAYVTANGGHFNICYECNTTSAYNAEFYCHKVMSCIK